jgi:hypothetical protein
VQAGGLSPGGRDRAGGIFSAVIDTG